MANKKAKSFRLDHMTEYRLSELAKYYGLTETEIVEKAISYFATDKFNFEFFSGSPELCAQRYTMMGLATEKRLRELRELHAELLDEASPVL